MSTMQTAPRTRIPNARPPMDPLLRRRLEALAPSVTDRGAGGPLPPPAPPGPRRSTRRVKPARSSRLAALAMSVAATAGLTAWFARAATAELDPVAGPAATTSATTPTATTPAATTPATVETTTSETATTGDASTTPVAVAAIADGTYTGTAANTRYGPVQVQVVYTGGVITDVVAIDYPDSDRKDVAINNRALPVLHDEAIAAQSAEIDTVSGATYTSNGYRTSLQSAIDAARQASGITG